MQPAAIPCSAPHAAAAWPAADRSAASDPGAADAAADPMASITPPRRIPPAGALLDVPAAPARPRPEPRRGRGWELCGRLAADGLALTAITLAGRSLSAGGSFAAACLVSAGIGVQAMGARLPTPRERRAGIMRGEAPALLPLTAAAILLMMASRFDTPLERAVESIYAGCMLTVAVTARYRAIVMPGG